MKMLLTKLCGIFPSVLCSLFCMFPAWANEDVVASVEYFYALDGTLIGKAVNGVRVNYEYDKRGQLLAVKDIHGKDLERYTYDPAGNRLSKTINGVTTTYAYDKANQLVSSTCNGETIHYKYDAAGRMIQAGDKVFRYGDMNKVVEISRKGRVIAQFEYFMDGQLASAKYGDKVETFLWDGLALIQRDGKNYINEPYVTGGNPVMAGDDVLFNDMLGSTLAVNGNPVEMTAFGETTDPDVFFTGKPMIPELGYSFLFRDYDPAQGKWTTSDPLGYPDGWNNLAYCNSEVVDCIDIVGTVIRQGTNTGSEKYRNFIDRVISVASLSNTTLGNAINNSNETVNFAQNNNVWPNTNKGFLGLQTPIITMDIYDYRLADTIDISMDVVRSPVFTLLHELAHVVANGSEESINQIVTQLLEDREIQVQLKQILSKFPSQGEISGTMRADGTYTVGWRKEYGE